MTLNLYMIHHKQPEKPPASVPSEIIHIQSGRAVSDVQLDMIGDDTGDSISKLNPFIAELSVHYWVWKNTASDFVGFQHYRRIFNFNPKIHLSGPGHSIPYTFYKAYTNRLLQFSDIQKHLGEADLIIPTPIPAPPTLSEQYKYHHCPEHWDLMVTLVEKKLTPSYKQCFTQFLNSPELHACILYVAKRDVFDDMMTWLFDFVLDLVEVIDPPKAGYQRKAIAYLAERLLHLYYMHAIQTKKIRVKTLDFVRFDDRKPTSQDWLNRLFLR